MMIAMARGLVLRASFLGVLALSGAPWALAQTYRGDGEAPFPDPKPAKREADLKRQAKGAIPKGEPPSINTPINNSLDVLKLTIDPKYTSCKDDKVAKLVGMTKEKALIEVKKMNLLVFRMLDPKSSVTYEVSPDRLTLVVYPDGIVTRSFCR